MDVLYSVLCLAEVTEKLWTVLSCFSLKDIPNFEREGLICQMVGVWRSVKCLCGRNRGDKNVLVGFFVRPNEGSKIPVPIVSQLCLLCVCACEQVCNCPGSCGPIWTFQRVKEAPAAPVWPPKIDQNVSAVHSRPMELKNQQKRTATCSCKFYSRIIWVKLCCPDSPIHSGLFLCSLLLLVHWFIHCIKYCLHRFGKRHNRRVTLASAMKQTLHFTISCFAEPAMSKVRQHFGLREGLLNCQRYMVNLCNQFLRQLCVQTST